MRVFSACNLMCLAGCCLQHPARMRPPPGVGRPHRGRARATGWEIEIAMSSSMQPESVAIEWFTAEQDPVRYGLSLRHGGVSRGSFATLNLGGGTSDEPAAVAENRARFYRAAAL